MRYNFKCTRKIGIGAVGVGGWYIRSEGFGRERERERERDRDREREREGERASEIGREGDIEEER